MGVLGTAYVCIRFLQCYSNVSTSCCLSYCCYIHAEVFVRDTYKLMLKFKLCAIKAVVIKYAVSIVCISPGRQGHS